MPHRILLVFLSAILLRLSFPTPSLWYLAWIALVPWLVALRGVTSRQALWLSYLCGLMFFGSLVYWVIHVTLVGLICLTAYLALFFGVFGFVLTRLRTSPARPGRADLGLRDVVIAPSLWVVLEWLRGWLFTGFPWGLLGYSQAPALPVIQIADLFGVYGVSFLIVLVNAGIAALITRQRSSAVVWSALLPAVCVAGSLGYGFHCLSQPLAGTSLRVAVVQGNIPQEEKWEPQLQREIFDGYVSLTRSLATQQPQLVIWPETSVPGYLSQEPRMRSELAGLARDLHAHLLVGVPTEIEDRGRWTNLNSAALFSPLGAIDGRYDKLHLVPFGEMVPPGLGWIRRFAWIGDFIPGQEATVFLLDDMGMKASALICFEDVFPELARRFVRQGAKFLINITNDAWFHQTGAAWQHAQASILRAVELRVPVARAANTGVSGFIDAQGRVLGTVHDAEGQTLFVRGTAIAILTVPPAGRRSGYARWGDWWLVVAATALAAVLLPRRTAHNRKSQKR
ncbi:MAG: apolipoprotein N-acyltransferase [Candidatus Omnitrophica bacterium]|nr:apolipoprotein N-acyltransferase [Candidatus Omnitrophota bacterium]